MTHVTLMPSTIFVCRAALDSTSIWKQPWECSVITAAPAKRKQLSCGPLPVDAREIPEPQATTSQTDAGSSQGLSTVVERLAKYSKHDENPRAWIDLQNEERSLALSKWLKVVLVEPLAFGVARNYYTAKAAGLCSGTLAGAANVDDLAVNRKHGNQARDLLRKAFRNTKWPPVYTFTAVSYNPAKQKNQTQDLSMLLPHELVHSLLKVNEPEDLMSRQESLLGNRADLQLHLDKMHNYGFEKTETLLTGLWMDGVPFNSDRSQSLETVVMNILCDSTMRLPIACFPKEFAAKKKTCECVSTFSAGRLAA